MYLTHSQKQTLANELVEVVESFQQPIYQVIDRYEAVMTQPSAEHLIIKLQPIKRDT